MEPKVRNLFAEIPKLIPHELLETLFQNPHVRVERIISRQHATPPDQWYDQADDEWVLLLSGSAVLRIHGREDPLVLRPGDAILLPAHLRHRVDGTDDACDTIWLAIHVATST